MVAGKVNHPRPTAAARHETRRSPTHRALLLPLWVLIVALLLIGCDSDQPAGTQRVVINDQPFVLELAVTGEQRLQGLSDREEIAEDGGMLFVFRRPQNLAFVMRRCLVPIDLLYLDAGGRIVDMHRMKVEPAGTSEGDLKRYESAWPAQFVIELKGGTIDKLQLQGDEKVDMPVERLKTLAE